MRFFTEKQFNELNQCLQKSDYSAASEILKQWSPVYLSVFQLRFPEHKKTLRLEAFTDLWQYYLDNIRMPGDDSFRFLSSGNISNADFVTGYFFYLLALKAKKGDSTEDFENYLQQAIIHSSIHAAQFALHELMTQNTEHPEVDCDNLSNFLSVLGDLAKQHGTPGYLLLAKGYFHLALVAGAHENPGRRDAALIFTWKTLQLARLAEGNSSIETHNAYFGNGLSRSNALGIESIDKMLSQCLKLAGSALPLAKQRFIEKEAKREYEAYKAEKGSSSFATSVSL